MNAYTDLEFTLRRKDAISGSRKLRNAILRSLGHKVPSSPRKPAAPVFLAPHDRRGRPKGLPNGARFCAKRIKHVQLAAGKCCRVRIENLLGPRKTHRAARARQIAMWVVRNELGVSYPQIGLHFNRDHTTVIYACREVQKAVDSGDRKTIVTINAIVARLAA